MGEDRKNNDQNDHNSARLTAVDPDQCVMRYDMKSQHAFCLRPLWPDDKETLRAGVAALSDQSRYLRFFSGARTVPEPIIDRLADSDQTDHIAWGAIDLLSDPPMAIAAGHAIRVGKTDSMEIALAVLDEYQGLGVARLLLTEIAQICQNQGVTSLTAETLAENRAARRLFQALGGVSNYSSGPVVRYTFQIEEFLIRLKSLTDQLVHKRTRMHEL